MHFAIPYAFVTKIIVMTDFKKFMRRLFFRSHKGNQ
jgi:hypothetical protein